MFYIICPTKAIVNKKQAEIDVTPKSLTFWGHIRSYHFPCFYSFFMRPVSLHPYESIVYPWAATFFHAVAMMGLCCNACVPH